ncbi:hypothetical protein SLS55_009091 [Diplodia seriata]|uniref:Uncharacterized protein n=1 Tax=Diplodia seriata TaxID=420778 RepID=A0ABR3C934_9PEZI
MVKGLEGSAAALSHLLENLTSEQKANVEKQYHALQGRYLSGMPEGELTELLLGLNREDSMIRTRKRPSFATKVHCEII